MIWISLAIVLSALLATAVWASQQQSVLSRRRRAAIVTLKTGEAFRGVTASLDARAVVLRQAVAVGAGPRSEDVTVDGEVLVLIQDVAYVQFP